MLTLTLLTTSITDGAGNPYKVFSGFLPSGTLSRITQVPAFSDQTTHAAIGQNVNANPVADWQRPEIPLKTAAIKERFNREGEIMPNPVLLATVAPVLPVVVHTAEDGTQTCEVIIDEATRPLIVLDGQHRIKGLSETSRPENPIPFVLLADVGAQAYNPSMFARIFAEVTTQSSRLDTLHDAWLSYAFKLDEYEPNGSPPSPTPSYLAMETTTALVRWSPAAPVRNPFHDKIRLNPNRGVDPPMGKGFSYDAVAFSSLVKDGYFANPNRSTNLAPQEIAEAVSGALVSLSRVCTTPMDRSVFFGASDFRQQPMQDAFLLAVLSTLATTGIPGDWDQLLKNLNFNTANWNFKTWVARLDGNTGGRSRTLAKSILTTALEAGSLPPGVADIPTHLKGDGASISLTFARMGNGRVQRNNQIEHTFPVSRFGVETMPTGDSYKVFLKGTSTNVGRITAWDTATPRDEGTRSTLENAGMLLERPANDAREIHMKVEYYGGVEETFKLSVNW